MNGMIPLLAADWADLLPIVVAILFIVLPAIGQLIARGRQAQQQQRPGPPPGRTPATRALAGRNRRVPSSGGPEPRPARAAPASRPGRASGAPPSAGASPGSPAAKTPSRARPAGCCRAARASGSGRGQADGSRTLGQANQSRPEHQPLPASRPGTRRGSGPRRESLRRTSAFGLRPSTWAIGRRFRAQTGRGRNPRHGRRRAGRHARRRPIPSPGHRAQRNPLAPRTPLGIGRLGKRPVFLSLRLTVGRSAVRIRNAGVRAFAGARF